MATLVMPAAPGFRNSRFSLQARSQTHTSPLTGTVQTLELPGAVWQVNYELPPMKRPLAAPWTAFLVNLMGEDGRFFGFDPDARVPLGSYDQALDTPLVAGAAQTGATLNTDGWRINQTALLLPGDYFGLTEDTKKRIHMITANVDSDGAGAATLSFKPPLRASPAENAVLVLIDPVAEMKLASDEEAIWSTDQVPFYNISFTGVEALG